MALTQTVEYALRAIVWLAQNPGQPQTTHQIAEATQVPTSYLPKVFAPLIRNGLISGQRGLHGGYTLERDSNGLTLLEVVNCVDPIQRIERCPLNLLTHGARLCPLHSLLNRIIVAEVEQLRGTTVGELLTSGGKLKPLCEIKEQLHEAQAANSASTKAGRSKRPRRNKGRSGESTN